MYVVASFPLWWGAGVLVVFDAAYGYRYSGYLCLEKNIRVI